jgi:hypothetical protein
MPRVRPKTLSTKQLRLLPLLQDDDGHDLSVDHERPKTRADCVDGPRPCPYVGCRFHLYLDVDHSRGSVKFNYPEVGPDELEKLEDTCALDIADRGEHTLEEVSRFMNFTSRERTRQIVGKLMEKVEDLLRTRGVDEPIMWNKEDEE